MAQPEGLFSLPPPPLPRLRNARVEAGATGRSGLAEVSSGPAGASFWLCAGHFPMKEQSP
jgi:hypothetical protein